MSCVQVYELKRRGVAGAKVNAGPLEKSLRKDEGGPGGRPLGVITSVWNRSFTVGDREAIEAAFSVPGSRGVVFTQWKGKAGAGHVFNVENVEGKVRFIDSRPTLPRFRCFLLL